MKVGLIKFLFIPLLCLQLFACAEERVTIDTGKHGKKIAASKAVYYHGSPFKLDRLSPQAYTRVDDEGNITYESRAVRAFPDKRIALLYTYNDAPGYRVGVNLANYTYPTEPIVYTIIGGDTKEQAITRLYGSGKDEPRSHGYLYTIDGGYFHKDPGLGEMEVVSHKSVNKFVVDKINKRKMLNEYINDGLVEILWLPD